MERWIWILAIIFFLAALNLLSVKVFGELEFWFSLIKVVAIIAMIAGGAAIIVFGFQAGGATVAPGPGQPRGARRAVPQRLRRASWPRSPS